MSTFIAAAMCHYGTILKAKQNGLLNFCFHPHAIEGPSLIFYSCYFVHMIRIHLLQVL